jgi:rhodanese-related sulfurtransferase
MRAFNQAGPRLRRDIAMPAALTAVEFSAAAADAIVVDTRSVSDYSAAHIPGSLHIELRDTFAVWLGWLLAPDRPLLFVADEGTLTEIVDECLLVGCERFAGWLAGGLEAWAASGRPTATTPLVDGAAAADLIAAGAAAIDVREVNEYRSGHVAGAHNLPLGELASSPLELRDGAATVVYCGHGERSSTAASILEQRGFARVYNVDGGLGAIRAALGEPGAV